MVFENESKVRIFSDRPSYVMTLNDAESNKNRIFVSFLFLPVRSDENGIHKAIEI